MNDMTKISRDYWSGICNTRYNRRITECLQHDMITQPNVPTDARVLLFSNANEYVIGENVADTLRDYAVQFEDVPYMIVAVNNPTDNPFDSDQSLTCEYTILSTGLRTGYDRCTDADRLNYKKH